MYPDAEVSSRHIICVGQPRLWDCDTPNLYQCRVEIECEGELLDEQPEPSVSVPFFQMPYTASV